MPAAAVTKPAAVMADVGSDRALDVSPVEKNCLDDCTKLAIANQIQPCSVDSAGSVLDASTCCVADFAGEYSGCHARDCECRLCSGEMNWWDISTWG